MEEARAIVRGWKQRPRRATFVDEWDRLLSLPIEDVRRKITRRTPDADRLRLSSPFALTKTRVMTADQRIKLWQKVKHPGPIARRTN